MKGETKICHYCEQPTKNPTRDHVFPLSKIRKLKEKGEPMPDGFDEHSNKVWACGACNTNKGTLDYDSFKALGITQIRHLKKMFLNKTIKKRGTKNRRGKGIGLERRW